MTTRIEGFSYSPIPDAIFEIMKGKSFKTDCTIPREELSYLRIRYVDLQGKTQDGEMVVNRRIAETVLSIFQELYAAKYPIEKIRLVDHYDADDERSTADNNSSSFNFRFISHTTKVSKHGMGAAIDINPLYNPYVKMVNGKLSIEPAAGAPYVDRSRTFPMKIDESNLAFQIFTKYGFEWGGSWEGRKDYQHFEIPDEVIKNW